MASSSHNSVTDFVILLQHPLPPNASTDLFSAGLSIIIALTYPNPPHGLYFAKPVSGTAKRLASCSRARTGSRLCVAGIAGDLSVDIGGYGCAASGSRCRSPERDIIVGIKPHGV
jgi:hypothetical protein